MNYVVGIGGPEYFDFYHADIPPETRMALSDLGNGKNIVTTFILRDKLGLNIGDILTLQFEDGSFDYRITGFLDTNWGIGHMGYISADNYITDIGAENYTHIAVKTDGDPDAVKDNILRAFSKDILSIQTKNELEAANADKVVGIFDAINTYAYFAMLIGLLGIINNMTVCFLSRLRNLALYRCIGMSGKRIGRMLMTEAMAIGVVGAFSGLTVGLLTTGAIPFLIGMLWGNVTVEIPVMRIAVLCICGIASMLLCSLMPLARGRKISIMENIRYE
jgi:putative ABC transport system permease protein